MKKLFLILMLSLVLFSQSAFATRVWITPDPAYTENDLTCNIEGNPNPNLFRFKWFQNGVLRYDQQGMNVLGNANTYIGDTWKCEVRRLNNQYEGEDDITITNRNPSVNSISISPQDPNTDDNLLCSITVSDPDNDPNGYLGRVVINWVKGSQTIRTQTISVSGTQANVQDTLTADQTGVGDTIKCMATVYDKRNSQSSGESQVTIINRNPTLDSISISPQNPTKDDDLTCSASASDPDGNDPQGYLDRIVFEWSKNGQVIRTQSKSVSGGSASQTDVLSHTNLNVNDRIKCKATVYDKKNAYAYRETEVNVRNRPPEARNVHITPTNPKTNDDLICDYQYYDPDGDPEGATEFSWYKNGINQNINSRILSHTYTTKHDQWYCKVKPKDSHGMAGDEVQSASVVIQNSPPQFFGPIPDQTWPMNTGKRINLSQYFSDIDGDALQYSNNPALAHISARYDATGVFLIPETNWYGSEMTKFYASDGEASVASNFVVLTVTRTNQPPVARLSAAPTNPQVNENVRFDGSQSYDPDGYVRYYFYDYGNGQNSGWVLTNYVYFAYQQPGIYYARLKVKDNDGVESEWSQPVMINVSRQQPPNQIPVAILSASPTHVRVNQHVRFDGSESYDPDGYIVSYYFDFGDGHNTGWISENVVYHAYQMQGEYITRLKVKDNLGAESGWVSVTIYVSTQPQNHPPIVDYVNIFPENPGDDDDLTCVTSVSDIDGNLDYLTFNWYRNDLLIRTTRVNLHGNSGNAQDVLSARQTSPRDVIKCSVRVYDNESAYGDGFDIVTIGGGQPPQNRPPVINSIQVIPEEPEDNDDLLCSATVSDPDRNLYYVAFKWTRNGNLVRLTTRYVSGGSASAQDILDHTITQPMDSIKCEATVYDTEYLSNSAYRIVFIRGGVIPTNPVAILRVNPSNLEPFQTATFDGSDSYDPDGRVVAYFFDFGDGVNSGWISREVVTHSYNREGRFIAKLKVRDNSGLESAWSEVTVSVSRSVNRAPSVDMISITPEEPKDDDNLLCSVSVSDQDGNLNYVMFRWYRNNALIRTQTKSVNGFSDRSSDTLSYVYTQPRDLIECEVIVYDRENARDDESTTVTISENENEYPVAILSASPIDPNVNENVRFDGSESYDPDGYIVSYYFDFGDGYNTGWTSNAQVYHSYRRSGTYYAKLRVKDDKGLLSEWDSVTIYVGEGGGGGGAPEIDSIEISPSNPYEDEDLKCRVYVSDPNGDLDYIRFRWYVNDYVMRTINKEVSGYDDYDEDVLDESYVESNDKVKCEATVYDYDGNWDTESDYVNVRERSTQEYCDVAITEFDYSEKILENQNAWVRVVIKNKGSSYESFDISLYVDGSLKNTYTQSLNPEGYYEKTFNVPLSVGTHEIMVQAYAHCGIYARKYATIKVEKPNVSVSTPPEPPTGSMKDTDVKIYPGILDIELGSTGVIYVYMETPYEQTFEIDVTGIPEDWLDYEKTVSVSDIKTSYIKVSPQVLGSYSFTVTVKGLDKDHKERTFTKDINMYVAHLKTQKMVIGSSGSEILTGFVSALKENWIIGVFLLVIIGLITLLYIGKSRLKKEKREEKFEV